MKKLPKADPEKIFLDSIMNTGLSLKAAASKAWPKTRNPVQAAIALLKNADILQAKFRTHLDSKGLTDEKLAESLAEALSLASDDPKASKAILDVTKELVKIKNLYAPPTPAQHKESQMGLGDGANNKRFTRLTHDGALRLG